MRTVLTAVLFVIITFDVGAQTQSKAAYLTESAVILEPATHENGKSYPLYIFMPFTGGSARDFYFRFASQLDIEPGYIMLPAGTPQRDDYLPDFMSYIRWYEEQLLKDIQAYSRDYDIDKSRIYLAGFSLGGDLSWALILRNPSLFAGAIMAGTRTSYPPPAGSLETLKERDFRAVFIIGKNELPARYNGIKYAHTLMQNKNVNSRLKEVQGGHVYGSAPDFITQLKWIISGKTSSNTIEKPTILPIQVEDISTTTEHNDTNDDYTKIITEKIVADYNAIDQRKYREKRSFYPGYDSFFSGLITFNILEYGDQETTSHILITWQENNEYGEYDDMKIAVVSELFGNFVEIKDSTISNKGIVLNLSIINFAFGTSSSYQLTIRGAEDYSLLELE